MKVLLNAALSAILCIFSGMASAQITTVTVSGIVAGKSDKPAAGATVSLLKAADSALVKVFITGADGKFEFEQVKDTFLIAVSFVGYAGYISTPFIVKKDQTSLELPVISLQERSDIAIEGVTVVAVKPFVERKIDRVVVNPDALISNAGANALEVLEKSPGVQVSLDGAISLKGKQGVVILINDRPTNLSGAALANYLKSLPSSVLSTIEIMTNPPAKYDAAGNAGVINIRLKKTTAKGWSGSINISYGQGVYARNSNSLNFNCRVNKVNFFGNLAYNINNDYQELDIERSYLKPNGSLNSSYKQNSYIKNERKSGSVRLGMDYYVSKKLTMGLVLNGFNNPSTVTTTSNGELLNTAMVLDSSILAGNNQHEEWKNRSINLNFNFVIDQKGSSLSMNADHVRYRLTSDQALTTSAFLPNGNLKSRNILIGNLPTDIDISTAKIDFTHPLRIGGNLEAGAKLSFINTKNTADFFDRDNSGTYVNYDLSNQFKYDENINAAYLNFNREFKKLSIQAGLRLEQTSVKGNQLGNPVKRDSSFRLNYTNLFPTFYLSYKLDSNGNNQLGFSYGRRIKRANYQDLNPFIYPLDKFTYFSGNPYLKPTFSHNFELSHTFMNSITTTLQYSYTRDIIQETIEQSGNLFISRPGNIGRQTDIGISVNAGLQTPKIKWWSLQLYTEVMNNHFQGVLYNQALDIRGTYWLISGTNQLKLSKLWSAELGGFYKTNAVSGQFKSKSIWIMRIGAQKKILKEKGTVKFVVNDVFYSFQPRGEIISISNAMANYFNYLDSRVATISFSYRLNKGKSLRARQSGGSDSEKNRININK
jgi:iron complex outermembrane recepter protein